MVTDDSDKVVEAAPILYWTKGKPLSRVVDWVEGKGGTVVQAK